MKKLQWKSPKGIAAIVALALILVLTTVLAGCNETDNIVKVPAEDEYVYYNPDETKAEPDAGMKLDGVLDEEIYDGKNWLYLSNSDAGNNVDIAMTSHFGEKGMYFAFDVNETSPIYVNPERSPVLNSCIELYLAPPYVTKLTENSIFEIDLLPTGDIAFKKSDGKYGYINVATTNDKMAYLGATTKGGEVNTPDCYGYVLELFIPWDYLQWLKIDVQAIKDGHIFVNPAHITSHNYVGKDINVDRYWYHYVQQIGADFNAVTQYFRFDGNGAIGTKEIILEEGEHYRFEGHNVTFPGMQVPITVIPDAGYALTSILVDGQEQINKAVFNEDGSVTVLVRSAGADVKVSAAVEAVTEGKKTISGKVHLNGMTDLLVSYIGPLGEKPVIFDADGNFEIKDLDPGYYLLKVEKQGLGITTHGIYLNRDIYTELVLRVPLFNVTGGTSWILDDANMGILYKITGQGNIISKTSYNDFTVETYVKYDLELAKLGNDDYYLQQRSGVRVLFSNGKYWHINLLREGDKYVIQYGKITGDDSIYSWKNVHTLTEEQVAKYTGADGIKLTVKRVGNKAAIFLDDKVLFIEELAQEYQDLTAQIGFEAWIANSAIMTVPYKILENAVLPEAPKIYFYSANTWDVSQQDKGIVYKTGVSGVDTWLDAAMIANDITTIAKDYDPVANNYSMIYIFKFSNGEQFRVRLNHTDNDGKYRIQSMSGSTVFDAWKNHYTLTEEQAQKVQNDGISYRVWICGTTAYVYLDGQEVCTYDLSKVVATGQPSNIDQATTEVHLRIDGNHGKTFEVPFALVQTNAPVVPEKPDDPDQPTDPVDPIDPAKKVNLSIISAENGFIRTDKTAYAIGDTVKLTVTPAAGYAQKLYLNGEPILLDWKSNTYTFVATQKDYAITGSFIEVASAKPSDVNRWDWSNQAFGYVTTYYPVNNDSWYMDFAGEYRAISVMAKNFLPMEDSAESATISHGFSVVLRVTMDNGNIYSFRILNKQDNGVARYEYTRFGSGGSQSGWGGWTTIESKNPDATALLNGEGIEFKLERTGDNELTISLGGAVLDTYVMSGITANNKVVSMGVMHQGNSGAYVKVPFTLTDAAAEPPVVEPPVVEPPAGDPVQVKIPALANGSVKANKNAYVTGEVVQLTVTPNAGYVQKLYINGKPLLLDWKTNTYSFVATEESYEITGSFEKSLDTAASDAGRWDESNQAHGVLNAYYPNNNDAWWFDIKGEYSSIAITAKNYFTQADSMDGNGKIGYSQVLRITLDNGSFYGFRIINDKGTYAFDFYGAGSANGWGNWKRLDDATVAALGGDGVIFKLERTGADTLSITLNGVEILTYTMTGVTAANKVVSVGTHHYGNSGMKVEIPFEVK